MDLLACTHCHARCKELTRCKAPRLAAKPLCTCRAHFSLRPAVCTLSELLERGEALLVIEDGKEKLEWKLMFTTQVKKSGDWLRLCEQCVVLAQKKHSEGYTYGGTCRAPQLEGRLRKRRKPPPVRARNRAIGGEP